MKKIKVQDYINELELYIQERENQLSTQQDFIINSMMAGKVNIDKVLSNEVSKEDFIEFTLEARLEMIEEIKNDIETIELDISQIRDGVKTHGADKMNDDVELYEEVTSKLMKARNEIHKKSHGINSSDQILFYPAQFLPVSAYFKDGLNRMLSSTGTVHYCKMMSHPVMYLITGPTSMMISEESKGENEGDIPEFSISFDPAGHTPPKTIKIEFEYEREE